jgi:hypothetical protein
LGVPAALLGLLLPELPWAVLILKLAPPIILCTWWALCGVLLACAMPLPECGAGF